MSGHNTGNTSRKPSGSSTHSGAHSPTSSPSNAQAQRKLPPGVAGNVFGVGMSSSANGLKSLNSGWQVWSTATPPSKRNASISSVASAADLSPSQVDSTYRGNLGEGWVASRPVSGTWEEINGSPQKTDYSQLESHSSLNLHPRQRHIAFPGPRIDDRPSVAKNGQFSPHRYDNGLVKDPNTSRYSSTASPTKHFGSGLYASQQAAIQGSNVNYDPVQASSVVENDLALTLRGMAVEDDYNVTQSNRQNGSNHSMSVPVPNPQIRAPLPPLPQSRPPYNGYPPTDYTAYYANTGRESYVEYPYGYNGADPYASVGINAPSPATLYPGMAPQNLHPSAVADLHRQQSGIFYDYGTVARPHGTQFYYPSHPNQGMMYPPTHSPMMTPQMSSTNPPTLGDKKREFQYNIQQHIVPQNIMYGALRSTPSPHSQAYATAIDYNSSIPVMVPAGALYGQGLPVYTHGARFGRRNDINDATIALRSPLLDEFRANKARKWELRDILGYIVEFSGDQHGSRFIQQKLESATSEEKQTVFDEIVPDNTLQLIQDVFGNYVIQKLFEHGTQVQKTVLANTMEGHVLPLALQMYGCRVVQKAVEFILPDQQGTFVKELEPHVLKCVKDANGNHVIQKLIERVSPDRLGFVNSFRGNVYDLSTHPYGCRVLQRCLEHLPDEHTRPLLEEMHKYTVNLMQDQFGNYVIQFILEHGQPHDKAQVIAKLRGQMIPMARHKFASNVCEKALITAEPEIRRILIDEIMTGKQDGVNPIMMMMKDQFANYVLQRALAVVEGEQKEALISKVRPQLATMRRYSSAYSKHLISIERLLEKHPLPKPEHAHEIILQPELVN